jgi:hypothetical protein
MENYRNQAKALISAIEKIPNNIRLEAVGEATDIYLNIFPIILSATKKELQVYTKVGNELINQYGEIEDCSQSKPNVLFQDISSQHLEQICDVPEYSLKRVGGNEYEVSEIKKVQSSTIVLEYLQEQNIRFF